MDIKVFLCQLDLTVLELLFNFITETLLWLFLPVKRKVCTLFLES